jgi:hypothetical protein
MEKNNERTYWVFQCATTHPNQRPLGRKMSEGCNTWGIKSSKYSDLGGMADVQANCKVCSRKPRLQPKTRLLYGFDNKEAAEKFCNQKNDEEVGF